MQALFVSLALSMYFTPCGQIIAYYFINGWTVYKTSDMVAKTTIFNFKSCLLLCQNNVSHSTYVKSQTSVYNICLY